MQALSQPLDLGPRVLDHFTPFSGRFLWSSEGPARNEPRFDPLAGPRSHGIGHSKNVGDRRANRGLIES